jgi:catechol 2,3-dioxygenase-like lactoylglutathione lyase family enzyme
VPAGLVAFLATCDLARSRAFFERALELQPVETSGFANVYDVGGTQLRVTLVQELTAAPFTVLGWQVDDVARAVRDLAARGVVTERYDGMPQDEAGVWTSPSGARIAWFKDPDGNTLSLQEAPAGAR